MLNCCVWLLIVCVLPLATCAAPPPDIIPFRSGRINCCSAG